MIVSRPSFFDASRFNAAINKRKKFFTSTNALRFINGRGDDLAGLAVDVYNKHFVVQLFDKRWEHELKNIQNYLQQRFDPDYLIVKWRTSSDGRSLDQPKVQILVEKISAQTVVTENNLKFQVDLNDTVNTGLFLDMRDNRQLIGSIAQGKRVLNCFSYSCSFGVYAQSHGSSDVVNVDISQKVLDKGRVNYQLNNLSYGESDFVKRDTEDYLLWAGKKNIFFDIIILDPPSFARYGNKVFAVKKELPRLIELAVKILNPGGFLFVATNCSDIASESLARQVKLSGSIYRRTPKALKRLRQSGDFVGQGMKESHLAAVLVNF